MLTQPDQISAVPDQIASDLKRLRVANWQEAAIPLAAIGTDAVLDLRSGVAEIAIPYARGKPSFPSIEMFRDTHDPVCRPGILRDGSPKRAWERPQYLLNRF